MIEHALKRWEHAFKRKCEEPLSSELHQTNVDNARDPLLSCLMKTMMLLWIKCFEILNVWTLKMSEVFLDGKGRWYSLHLVVQNHCILVCTSKVYYNDISISYGTMSVISAYTFYKRTNKNCFLKHFPSFILVTCGKSKFSHLILIKGPSSYSAGSECLFFYPTVFSK